MGLLNKLFGSKPPAPSAPVNSALPEAPAAPPAAATAVADLITVYDNFGRELQITRQDWRDKVLKGTLDAAWNDADKLADLVNRMLHDHFIDEATTPAERLMAVDPDSERSAILLGVTYLHTKRTADAKRVLETYLARHADSGVALTNLAKVYAAEGDQGRATETLWRAIEADPNQDNGLLWLIARENDAGGETAIEAALNRVAALPGSWRARLWLARGTLGRKNLPEAIRQYEQALAIVGDVVPADFLMQMSGDLGNAGHIAELLHLTAPRFDADRHGLLVGNNLIKSYVDLGRLDEARAIVTTLYAQKRCDWQQSLSYWDAQIAERQTAGVTLPVDRKLEMTLLTLDGPIWLANDTPAGALFPPPGENAPSVCFFVGTGERAADTSVKPGEVAAFQTADTLGRLTRAVPLFLAEQTYFRLGRPTETFVPWVLGERQGFLLSGKPWADADAAAEVRNIDPPPEFVVLTHVRAVGDPWQIIVRVVRTADAVCVDTFDVPCPAGGPDEAVKTLADRIVQSIAKVVSTNLLSPPSAYAVPNGPWFADYLLRLEQLMAVRCAGMEGVQSHFLSGEREIVSGTIRLCVEQPQNVTARILLARMLSKMKGVSPEAVNENADAVRQLQQAYPLPRPAHDAVQRMIAEVL